MHADHDTFMRGIKGMRKIRLTFFSKEDRGQLVRTCAPMDFGPSRRAKDKSDRYHLWDFESDTRNHTLGLPPTQIVSMELLSETFDPSDFVTWDVKASPWFVARDWGEHS